MCKSNCLTLSNATRINLSSSQTNYMLNDTNWGEKILKGMYLLVGNGTATAMGTADILASQEILEQGYLMLKGKDGSELSPIPLTMLIAKPGECCIPCMEFGDCSVINWQQSEIRFYKDPTTTKGTGTVIELHRLYSDNRYPSMKGGCGCNR